MFKIVSLKAHFDIEAYSSSWLHFSFSRLVLLEVDILN